jgi:hypothetical protein
MTAITFTLKDVLELVTLLGGVALVIFKGGGLLEALKKDVKEVSTSLTEHRREAKDRDDVLALDIKRVDEKVNKLSNAQARTDGVLAAREDTGRQRAYDPTSTPPKPLK